MKREKRPTHVSCYHCKRNLNFMQYTSSGPQEGTDPKTVKVIGATLFAGYTILCTCGHYMIFKQPSEIRNQRIGPLI